MFQSPPTPRNKGGGGDVEIMGLEDIAAEELEVEFDQLHCRSLTLLKTRLNRSTHFPLTLKLHKGYSLEEIDTIQKGVLSKFVSNPGPGTRLMFYEVLGSEIHRLAA